MPVPARASMARLTLLRPLHHHHHRLLLLLLMTTMVMVGLLHPLLAPDLVSAGPEEEYQIHVCSGTDLGLTVLVTALQDGLYSRAAVALYTLVDNIDPTSGYGVSVMYQCRGDLALSECPLCVESAFAFISRNCSDPSYAHVELQGCGVVYSNQPIDGGNYGNMIDYFNTGNGSTTLSKNRAKAMANVSEQAIGNKQRLGTYWAVDVAGNGTADVVYALAQCHGYLAPSNCTYCLGLATDQTDAQPQSLGQRIFYGSCFVHYETSLFYNANNTPTLLTSLGPPPSPSPSPSPSPFPFPSPTPGGSADKSSAVIPLAIGLGLGFLLIVISALLFFYWRHRRRKQHSDVRKEEGFETRVHAFSIDELKRATQNFDEGNFLGHGGFGQVYKGTLDNGEAVAVKKLTNISHQGESQFVAEVKFITSAQHRNLIRLHGYCVDSTERILVYEFVPNQSLDQHIFSKNITVRQMLSWRKRVNILIGTAKGLAYMHHDCHERIIHRDIKAANIMLDESLNPKITDFGLARLFGTDKSHVDTGVAGTLGYLAPEYFLHGHLTEKADVYSFGIVMLEVVCGRKVIDNGADDGKENLLLWARQLFEASEVSGLVDVALREDYDPVEAIRVVSLALSCTQDLSSARPSMNNVVAILGNQYSEGIANPWPLHGAAARSSVS